MDKLKIGIVVLFCGIFTGCYQIERNCRDFKTGKFKFEKSINGITNTTFFERNDSIEIETYQGKTDTSMVRWVSDCEYILTKKRPKSMADQKAVVIKILFTKKNSYTFEFGYVGSEIKQKGEAIKIK